MSEATAPELSTVLADNLTRLRREAGWTQDHVARLMRYRGLFWNRATVAQVETRRRQVGAVELLALFNSFAVEPEEFFRTEAPFVRVGDADWNSDMAANALRTTPDQPAELTQSQSPDLRDDLDASVKATRWFLDSLAKWDWGNLTNRQRRAIIGSEDATRAAKRLSNATFRPVSFIDVAGAAFQLYGRSISEERDARVSDQLRDKPEPTPRTMQALRGHVMRQLDREILAAIHAAEQEA
jgi:transcriptional regulator with XRE-family HTH domain